MTTWVRYDALNPRTGEHIQGSGVLVDVAPDDDTEDGWATFYIFADDDDGDEIEPICLRGRVTDHHLLSRLVGEP